MTNFRIIDVIRKINCRFSFYSTFTHNHTFSILVGLMADLAIEIFKEYVSVLPTPLSAVALRVHFFNLLVDNFKANIHKNGLPQELNETFMDMIYAETIEMVA